MKDVLVDLLLGLCVVSVWLGALGFVRMRTALDRLHCASFINLAAGLSLTLAVIVQDGLTSRSWKTVAVLVALLVTGSATSHAVGRAIYLRDGDRR